MPSVAILGTRGYPSYYGGFETAIRKLAPYLADQGWDVTVYGRPGASVIEDPSRDPRVRVRVTRGIENKSLSTLTFGGSAAVSALRRRPDVALVMNVANGFWLPMLRRASIPTLINVDGMEWERAKWGRLAKGTFRAGARLTARYGNAMVYDSHEIARRWKAEFGTDGYFIPYGGDVPAQLAEVEMGLKHRRYVLAVARFVPENSISEFLEAAEVLSHTTDVVIVGSSGYGGELDARAASLAAARPRVRWLGHVRDDARLNALWQNAGAYFHGHTVGGTNPALVQAMACAAPIVARDTVYNREVLADAAVYTSSKVSDIVGSIQRLLDDTVLQSQLSAAAHVRASEHYSWPAVNSAYEAALTDLIQTRNSGSGVDS